MKKLKLKLEGKQMLNKDQMKNVVGGVWDYKIKCYYGDVDENPDGVVEYYQNSYCGYPDVELEACRNLYGPWITNAVCYYA